MENRTILHVEDDLDEAFFLRRAIEKSKLEVDLQHLKNGEEAINYLNGAPPFHDRSKHPLPQLVLLDLKMPLKNGFEVLAWLKQKPRLTSIPVIILSSSDREEDISRAKSLGAISYLIKTVSFENVIKVLKDILQEKSLP